MLKEIWTIVKTAFQTITLTLEIPIRFKYGDKVKVTSGFYKGIQGSIIGLVKRTCEHGYQMQVEGQVIEFPPQELELIDT